jgi:capsular exopolysaccharide synthesis family protein
VKLRDFLAVLRARWLIILLCVVAVTGIAAALTYRQTPIYTTSADYYLQTKVADPTNETTGGTYVLTSSDLNTYVAVLNSDTVMGPLREKLKRDPGAPIDASASITGETSIFRITVRDPDPQRAAEIANEAGEALAEAADTFTGLLQVTNSKVFAVPVNKAGVPGTPTSPVPSRNLGLGLLAGLLVGIGIAFVRHTLDTKGRTELDIRPISKEPMLGEMPFEKSKSELVTIDRDPHGGYAEAVRRLRTNLMFVDVTTGRHSFIVTSAMPGEGKTTTTVNLAMAMATTGGRVLLVDGDLRNPSVAKTLGIEGAAGLTPVLLGQAEPADVIQRWRDSELYVLTAGAIPPNPSELLGSEPMRDLFDKLSREFDFILIDSPPVVPVVDAVLLDRLTGGTLMVVASSRTKKRDLASAVKQLETVEAKPLGFAMPFVPVNESDARRYGYYRFQEPPAESPGSDSTNGVSPRAVTKSRTNKPRSTAAKGGRRSSRKV